VSETTYKSLSSRILTTEVTAAARDSLSPAKRELLDRMCKRLAESLRLDKRRSMIGPVSAREIIAAVGRLLVERCL